MDENPTEIPRIGRLVGALLETVNRRTLAARLTAAGLTSLLARFVLVAEGADAERKRRKRRKKRCPHSRRCDKKRCCRRNEICAGGFCVTGQGTCATGADTCAGEGIIECNGNGCVCVSSAAGSTRCAQKGSGLGICGQCASDDDCGIFDARAFCVAAGDGCGCAPGQGRCALPCPKR